MARIKAFDVNTQAWVYADKSFGKTPVKGVDYFTETDKAEMSQAVSGLVKDEFQQFAKLVYDLFQKAEFSDDVSGLMTQLVEYTTNDPAPTPPAYKNQIPLSIDTDGSVFNGTGLQYGYRLNTNGEVQPDTNTTEGTIQSVSGFIPAKYGDVIYLKNISHYREGSRGYIHCYDSSFNHAVQVIRFSETVEVPESITVNKSTAAYIRISAIMDENSVLTINEPIE